MHADPFDRLIDAVEELTDVQRAILSILAEDPEQAKDRLAAAKREAAAKKREHKARLAAFDAECRKNGTTAEAELERVRREEAARSERLAKRKKPAPRRTLSEIRVSAPRTAEAPF